MAQSAPIKTTRRSLLEIVGQFIAENDPRYGRFSLLSKLRDSDLKRFGLNRAALVRKACAHRAYA
ncbi:hypothetical protein [Litorisediminicola beolgyonensis]|uniref:DUF1127 domain-containing protein n=1 Tax=Litorisediminicola beolgyonensis TaxID=1173614 RepID=A0ABW3ZP55_9RHOB